MIKDKSPPRQGTVQPLPIDGKLAEAVDLLRQHRRLILEAFPGAGKTTRLPPALIESTEGEIVVVEPRRLAAKLAATRVAAERGERPGQTIGYSVRYENVASAATRVRFVTPQVLLRRWMGDPNLRDVGVVVLDEFHERQLEVDLLLALVRRLQNDARPDLGLVVMSATLQATPLAEYLDGAPTLNVEGREFPITIDHVASAPDRELSSVVASATRLLLREDEAKGNILVFLPGAREIRKAQEKLERVAEEASVSVVPLHGDLPLEQQSRAVAPGGPRRVILSTNVAESSVTVAGVTAVIDSGIARVASTSPWTGLSTLETRDISLASATQRAGRAGRTAPGRVLRLYTESDARTRPERDAPEVTRADLSELVLSLAGAGLAVGDLKWLDAPPDAALAHAHGALRSLGAFGPDGVTTIGRRMLRLPVHPRIARVLIAGEDYGVADEAALVAALVSERDVLRSARAMGAGHGGARRQGARVNAVNAVNAIDASGPSDILDRIERFYEALESRFDAHVLRSLELDPGAARAVDRAWKQLRRLVKDRPADDGRYCPTDNEEALLLCILAGFADHVAMRRHPGGTELVLANGTRADLSSQSVVHDARLMVAVQATAAGGRGRTMVHWASRVEPEWLLDLYPDALDSTDEVEWNPKNERVESVSRLTYGSIVLDETRKLADPSLEASEVLAREAKGRGMNTWDPKGRLDQLLVRGALLATERPKLELGALSTGSATATLERACENLRSFAELRSVDLLDHVFYALPPETQRALDTLVPERVTLAHDRSFAIQYESGKPPFIELPLQELFGCANGPVILDGAVPLTLHLLAPNRRAVQVTRDLAGFWANHYAPIRKELHRRYPRHDWPEDGRTAKPPERSGGRKARKPRKM